MLGLQVSAKLAQRAACRHAATFEQLPGDAKPPSVKEDCVLQGCAPMVEELSRHGRLQASRLMSGLGWEESCHCTALSGLSSFAGQLCPAAGCVLRAGSQHC